MLLENNAFDQNERKTERDFTRIAARVSCVKTPGMGLLGLAGPLASFLSSQEEKCFLSGVFLDATPSCHSSGP